MNSSIKNKIVMLLSLLLIAGAAGFFIARQQDFFPEREQNPSFESLSSEEMYQKIISQRDIAIQKAISSGDYKCCISPPCTMCYMEANQWNNGQPGTCACDDLIAQGKEPCPQCRRGLCGESEEGTCEVKI